MNWKEFFKPTIWKMVLFIIMLIFLNPFSFHMVIVDVACETYPCNDCTLPIYYNLLGNDFYLTCGNSIYQPIGAVQAISLFLPILEYILSCLIIHFIPNIQK